MTPDQQNDPRGVSRRTVIAGGAGAALLLVNPWNPPSAAADSDDDLRAKAARRRGRRIDAGWTTPNGWPAEKEANIGGRIVTLGVTGTPFSATLAVGAPALILGYVLARFSAEIRNLDTPDIIGFKTVKAHKSNEANHSSGTAIDILPAAYAAPARDVFTAYERLVIRDILTDCKGTVEWAENRSACHFGICVPPSHPAIANLANQIRRDTEAPARRVGAWRV